MGLLNQVKNRTSKVVAAGSAQVIDLRDDRRRKALFCRLGELTYRGRRGDPILESDIDVVIDELVEIDKRAESVAAESLEDDSEDESTDGSDEES